MAGSVRILDVDVDAVTMAEAVQRIGEAIDSRRGHGGPPYQVATVNPEFVMRARRDVRFRQLLRACSLRTADGAGLALAGRILGSPFPGRVTGVDLTEAVSAAAALRGDRLFLVGAAPGVADSAATRLRERYPGLVIAGTHPGDPGEEGDVAVLAVLKAARPDIVLVAYGAPAQEEWSARNLSVSGAAVAIGVGGTFDYISGRVRRAPQWMRTIGLEWLFRLVSQPWRARRMLVLPGFLVLVVRQRIGGSRPQVAHR